MAAQPSRSSKAPATARGAAQPADGERKPPPPDSWASPKRRLRTWQQPELLGLVHHLFRTVPEAKAAIVGRVLCDQPTAAKARTLDELRAQVRRAVRPSRGRWPGNPDMRAARQVGDQYLRATSDAEGALALYIEMVEAAIELSFEFGWDDTGFYDAIWRAAQAAERQIPRATDSGLVSDLNDRIRRLLQAEHFPGWGMDRVLESLEDALSHRADELASTA